MASVRALFCLGCGADLSKRAGDRRVLTSSASRKVLPVWKEVVSQKLQETGKTIDIEATSSKPGYICRKCFCTYERFQRHKATLLASIESAVDQIPSVPDTSIGRPTRGRKRGGDQECASLSKRTMIHPSGMEHSPAVLVGVH